MPGTIRGGLVSNNNRGSVLRNNREGTITGGLVSNNNRGYNMPGTIRGGTPRNGETIQGLSLTTPSDGNARSNGNGGNVRSNGNGNVRSNINGFPIGPPTPKPKKQYPGLGLLTLQTLLKRTPKRYIKKVLANTLTGKEVRELSALKKNKLTNYVRRSIRPKKKKV
jgi:hypothetical protein